MSDKARVMAWVKHAFDCGAQLEFNPNQSYLEFNNIIKTIKRYYAEKSKKIKKVKIKWKKF